MNLSNRYMLMVTDQVPCAVISEWLRDPLFAAYVARRRKVPRDGR